MEQLFSTTTFWTWDSKRGVKLGAVKPWLIVLETTPAAENARKITIILFGCYCCLISKAKS